MSHLVTKLAATALTLVLSACGSPPDNPAADATAKSASALAVSDSSSMPAAFGQCAACHAVEPGKHGVGPSLAGVYGSKSGQTAGYAFSDAMKAASLTWDDKTLDGYLAKPMKMVPGTKMTFAGMADPAKRKEVIEYMKTLN